MTEARKRRRRDQRDANPPPMQLTDRDKAIVEAVYQYRVLRQDQVQALFFGSQAAAQRRLAHLYHHGFLERQFLLVKGGMMNSQILYLLDRRGEELLRAEGELDDIQWKRSDNQVGQEFLEHTLAINDFRVNVTLACRQLGYELLNWHPESQLKQDYDRVTVRNPRGRSREIPIVPDSYFALQTPRGRTHFFLELDRGKMTTKRFQNKIEGYLAYYQTGAYQERYGARSLRVLTVALGEKRLENLKSVTEQAGGKTWFWFGVLSQLTPENVLSAPVWLVAGDRSVLPLVEPL